MARQAKFGPNDTWDSDEGVNNDSSQPDDLENASSEPSRDSTGWVEDTILRPKRMDDMIGQKEVFDRIKIAVNAARKRNESLGHILFDGPPGLGKTTFATCIPRELGVPMQIGNGATLRAPKDVVPYLTNAQEGSVLFIDEIHRMQKTVEEFLYPAMEDFRIDIVMGEGVSARTMNIPLKPFTLIGATTRTGLISAPLRDRFQMREHLDFYSTDELTKIVLINAQKLRMSLDEDAAKEIASRSRGTPRLANNRLRWVRDYADAKAKVGSTIDLNITQAALAMQGIDTLGLDPLDQKYLNTLSKVFKGGPVGVGSIAHTINIATDTLEDEVEPFLLRSELIIRTPRGRQLTEKGFLHLGLDPRNYTHLTLF